MNAAFDPVYGRMSGNLGLELPVTNALTQNLVLYGYASPPVDVLRDSLTPLGSMDDGTQIWKVTHNGVDTHPIHFHLFDVQLVNRVAWDAAMLPPEPNELGWKETVRMNPLEHCIVAIRPKAPDSALRHPQQLPADRCDPTSGRYPDGRCAGLARSSGECGSCREPHGELRLGIRLALPHPEP